MKRLNKCFEKSIYIWKSIYQTELHPSIADCWYNLSVIYKKQRFHNKALNEIEKWIKIRQEVIGKDSLPLAMAYEHYGKLLFEMKQYK